MSLHNEVLEHLTSDENKPMTSAQLYAVCKGAESSSAISTALSQLFKLGRISRKVSPSGSGGLYLYWKNQESVADSSNDNAVNSQNDEAVGIKPAEQVADIDSVVNGLLNAKDAAAEIKSTTPGKSDQVATISLMGLLALPTMPDKLIIKGLRPASLDDAFAIGSDFSVDVGTLDELAIEQVITNWGVEFRRHVAIRKQKLA